MVTTTESTSKKRGADDQLPDSKRRRRNSEAPQYGSTPVLVVVGDKTFLGHKDILTRHSDFFAAALSQDWKESADNKVTLGDDRPESFKIFLDFLYTGQLFTIKDGDIYEKDDGGSGDMEFGRLVACWVLAEKLLCTPFKDVVTDAIIAKIRKSDFYPNNIQRSIYKNSAGPSGMRRLVTDVTVWYSDDEDLHSISKEIPDFFFDVAIALNKVKRDGLQGDPPFEEEESCYYHDHGDKTLCYKTLFSLS